MARNRYSSTCLFIFPPAGFSALHAFQRLSLPNFQFSKWSFPFICSIQKLAITILPDKLELLSVLFVFPSFLAPKLLYNITRKIWTISACLKPSFLETADFNFTFSLAQIPFILFITQLAALTGSFIWIFFLLLFHARFTVCTAASNFSDSHGVSFNTYSPASLNLFFC